MKNERANEKNLMRRYLVWCYKTTKEDLDRIDRKFTQLKVDEKILRELKKAYLKKDKFVEEYKTYIANKKSDALKAKFEGSNHTLAGSYVYLVRRLNAVERAIGFLLGKKELSKIISLYEEEMTRRILESREH